MSVATQRLHCLIGEESVTEETIFSDRTIKKKTRKRKKSKLLEATQSKKLKQETPVATPPILIPPKSADFWSWVGETASFTPESSQQLLAEMIAKPADLGDVLQVTRRSQKKLVSSNYYAKLNTIKKTKDDAKMPSDTSKLEAGIQERLNKGLNEKRNLLTLISVE